MAILNVTTIITGASGQTPRIIYIDTTNTRAEVLATGFLNNTKQMGYDYYESDMALVTTRLTPSASSVQVGWYEITKSGQDISLTAPAAPGSVVLPTVLNHIVYAVDTAGSLSTANGVAIINGGNIQAGLSGTAGTLISFPATAARGSLIVSAVANTGNTNVTISNAAHGQASVISIPDGGQATSNFIISNSAGTQTIATGSLSLTLGNITAAAGNIAATLGSLSAGTTVTAGSNLIAGSAAGAGHVTSFSGSGANEFLRLQAINNTAGDFSTTINNAASVGQSQVITIPDAGGATGTFALSSLATPSPGANLLVFNVTVGQAALAAGGNVALVTSSGTRQYRVWELIMNLGGTNFSGGGGDRLGQVTDGTTVYSLVPAASLQTLANARWGDTAMPYPAAAAINTATVAGQNLRFAYSGGAADYTAGSVVISGIVERIA